MKNFNEIVLLNGSGKTKKDAVNEAISKIQDNIMKKYPDDLILKIDPKCIEIKQMICDQVKDRFLFITKKKKKYTNAP